MAQNKKISQLNSLPQAASNDLFPIVDVATAETKNITAANLFAAPLPIGVAIPGIAFFTFLNVGGTAVSAFSTDGTLGGDSNATIPTEKAIKTYVDNAISDLSPNRIIQGDSKVEVLDSTSSPSIINFVINSSDAATLNSSGLRLATGSRITEFSDDITLSGASSTAVPTEHAVKQYVDSAITGRFFSPSDARAIVYIDSTGGLEINKQNFEWDDVQKGLTVKGNVSVGDNAPLAAVWGKTVGLGITKNLTNPSTSLEYVSFFNSVVADSTSEVWLQKNSLVKHLSNSTMTGIKTELSNLSNDNGGEITGSQLVVTSNGSSYSLLGEEINVNANTAYVADNLFALKITGLINTSTIDTNVYGIDVNMVAAAATVIGGNAYGIKLKPIDPQFVTGTSYGLYIGDDALLTVPDWSIYVAGASSKVKFNGNIEMAGAVSINEFSNDITLADDSQTALVTEHAVKAYVNSSISSPNKIYQGHVSAEAIDNTSISGLFINAHNQVLSDSTSTLQSTFRFDRYLTTTNWDDPERMVDGRLITYAKAGLATGVYVQINNGNTADATSHIGTITKVELRINSSAGVGNITSFTLTPIYNGITYGTLIDISNVSGWSGYYDITSDSGAPTSWTWEDINNLDTRVQAIIGSPGGNAQDYAQARQIEIRVTYLNQHYVDGSAQVGKFDKHGLKLELGTSIKEFSTDSTLGGNSDTAIPTEKAIKTYVDYQIDYVINHLDLMKVRMIFNDSTADSGDIILVDSTADISILMMPKVDGKYVIKNLTTKKVTLVPYTGTIDGQSILINHTMFKSVTLASNGANFYII